jgi:uncharacterized protein
MNESPKKSYLDWSGEGRSSLLFYIPGLILVLLISLFVGQLFGIVGTFLIHSTSPAATIIIVTFFGFIFSFITIPILVRLLHNRPWWSIAMPKKSIDYKRFALGFFTVLCLQALLTIIGYVWKPEEFTYNGFDPMQWIPMFFIAAIAFFVQASAEEMVYRGYITQFAYRISKNPIFFLLVPAFLFSLPHFGNITGAQGIYSILPYIEMGLMFGWIAYRSGSLWMSIGAHLANNWFVTLFVGSSADNIKKISLFSTASTSSSPADQSLSSLIYLVAVVLILEFLMRKTHTLVVKGNPDQNG